MDIGHRSIRAFNKFLIMVLPVVLSPYFVHVAQKARTQYQDITGDKSPGHLWTDVLPYVLSVFVAFVFSALQGVQVIVVVFIAP